jgi:hypothetical protein
MSDIYAMAKMLAAHGERFAGNDPVSIAEDWGDHDFTPSSADEWCSIGVWDPAAAAAFRDADLTPGQVSAAARRLNGHEDRDVIYEVCNGDLDASVVIEAAK